MCREDAKNREARAELASVTAALKARKVEERAAYSSMFSGKSVRRRRRRSASAAHAGPAHRTAARAALAR